MIKLLEILNEIKNDISESFKLDDLSTEEQINLYNLYKNSYEKSVGTAWNKNKFLDKAEEWKFFGDQNGYVAIRPQQSGLYKLIVVGGNNKSILKGIQELTSTNKPIWGMVSKDIVGIMKKMNFTSPSSANMKILLKVIPKDVFGDVDFKINSDGSITFNYEDTGSAQKYFVGNKQYFAWLKNNLNPFKSTPSLKPLTEAKQVGNLYHFTPLKNIIPILSTKYLMPNDEGQISTSVRVNMSTTFFSEMGYDKSNIARLTLDGDKISNKYKIRPFSYDEEDLGEEQIVVKNKNFPFLPYLKRIDFFIVKPEDKDILKVEKILQKANIKYNIYKGAPLDNVPYNQSKEGNPKDIKTNKLPISYTADELYKLSPRDITKTFKLYESKSPYNIYRSIVPQESSLFPGFYVYLTNDKLEERYPLPSSLLALKPNYRNNSENFEYIENLGKDKIKSLSFTPRLEKIPMLDDPEWRKKWKYIDKNDPLYGLALDFYTHYILIPKDKISTEI